MSYSVEWTSPAQRDLARLTPRQALPLLNYLDHDVRENPYRCSGPLRDDLASLRKVVRGAYRALIKVDDDTQTIWVVRVDHRGSVYRTR